MLVDGQEADRVVGATSSGRLEQMLALARPASRIPPGGAGGQGILPATWVAGGNSHRDSVSIPAEISSTTFAPPGLASPSQNHIPSGADAGGGGGQETAASQGPDPAQFEAYLIACAVRLRIQDANGHSCGSGTIVDARGEEALILTCGHLFRDSQGNGRIEVDLFGPNAAERIPGELVHYDLEKDLALLKIRVHGPVRTARIAPPEHRIAKGARVVNVGCNNGDPPTVRHAHVTALDKFLGPANVVVSGLPVQGRSGGGLFTADGLVIGVCNAAVPTDNEGLYAALASIHAELDQTQLPFVYREPTEVAGSKDPRPARLAGVDESRPARDRLPAASGVAVSEPPSMPRKMPPPADLVQLTDAPGQPATAAPAQGDDRASAGTANASPPSAQGRGPARGSNEPNAAPQTLSSEEQAALEEIQRRKAEGAELICIVRSRTDPSRRSEVIVLDRVSPSFLEQLTSDPPHSMAGAASHPPERKPWTDASRPPAAPPPQRASAPLGQTTDATSSFAAPSSEWAPRWLQSGYPGS
jgi:S1-C subfamily serine protease